jgi:hypothetical protein
MANWDKLNKEFDSVINNISDKEFLCWYDNIEIQKDLCQLGLTLDESIMSIMNDFHKFNGQLFYQVDISTSTPESSIFKYPHKKKCVPSVDDNDNFSFAA